MFGFEILAKLFKILRSGSSPAQIAWGFNFGMIIGLTPLMSLHNLLILILVIVFNVNLSVVFFSLALFSGFAYLLDPLFHNFGYYLLTAPEFLQGFYTAIYNIPLIALSNFNNTVVIGSFISSLLLLTPFFFGVKSFVVVYREKIDPKLEKLKIVKIVKSSKIYGFYEKIRDWRD